MNFAPRRLVLSGLGAALLLSAGGCGEGPSGITAARTTAKLESTFPLLESFHVIAFRHENWCQAIEYKRGRYASSSGKACVGILSGSRRPYDAAARRDHATILTAIREAHDGVHLLKGLRYGLEGNLVFGIFDCSTDKGDLIYIYSKAPLDPEKKIEGHRFKPLGDSWHQSL